MVIYLQNKTIFVDDDEIIIAEDDDLTIFKEPEIRELHFAILKFYDAKRERTEQQIAEETKRREWWKLHDTILRNRN